MSEGESRTASYPTESDGDGDGGVTGDGDADDDVPGDDETTSARTRHPYTNDFIAGVTLVGLTGIAAAALLGSFDVGTLPQWFRRTYATVCLLAAVWTFGQPAVDALTAVRGK